MLSFAIRCDSSMHVGTGHVMRMTGLALKLRDNGNTVIFICKRIESANFQQLTTLGFEIIMVDSDPDWVKRADVRAKFPSRAHAAIVVDSYTIDKKIESSYRDLVHKVFVFDDINNREHDCDLLIDPNYHSDEFVSQATARVGPGVKQLIGPEYAILRQEFKTMKRDVSLTSDSNRLVKRPLIFFGGTDPSGETLKFLTIFESISRQLGERGQAWPTLVVLLGPNVEDKAEIIGIAGRLNAVVHVNPPNVAEVIAACDFYIGSGGTITYERMLFGVTGYVFSVADNQIEISQALARAGAQHFLGSPNVESYSNVVRSLMSGVRINIDQVARCFSLLDGNGADRVAAVFSREMLGKGS